jgi:hypothetical protein
MATRKKIGRRKKVGRKKTIRKRIPLTKLYDQLESLQTKMDSLPYKDKRVTALYKKEKALRKVISKRKAGRGGQLSKEFMELYNKEHPN